MDDETRQLQTEGCAPKLQLPPDQIKREDSRVEIVGDIKREKDTPKKVTFVF